MPGKNLQKTDFFSSPGTDGPSKQMRLLGRVQIRSQKKTDHGSKQINKLKQELVCIPQPSNKPQGIFSAETQRQRLNTWTEPCRPPPLQNPPQKNLPRAVSTSPAWMPRHGGRARRSNYYYLQERSTAGSVWFAEPLQPSAAVGGAGFCRGPVAEHHLSVPTAVQK